MQESDSNRDRQIVVNPAVGGNHASPRQLQRVNHVLQIGPEVKPPGSEGGAQHDWSVTSTEIGRSRPLGQAAV